MLIDLEKVGQAIEAIGDPLSEQERMYTKALVRSEMRPRMRTGAVVGGLGGAGVGAALSRIPALRRYAAPLAAGGALVGAATGIGVGGVRGAKKTAPKIREFRGAQRAAGVDIPEARMFTPRSFGELVQEARKRAAQGKAKTAAPISLTPGEMKAIAAVAGIGSVMGLMRIIGNAEKEVAEEEEARVGASIMAAQAESLARQQELARSRDLTSQHLRLALMNRGVYPGMADPNSAPFIAAAQQRNRMLPPSPELIEK